VRDRRTAPQTLTSLPAQAKPASTALPTRSEGADVETVYATTVFGVSISTMLWLFLLYSVLGVLVEGLFCLAVEGYLELRLGLLYLPLRPIYGIGGAACALLLSQYLHEPVLIFLLGAVIGDVVEYVAGFVVEKLLRTTSWDYRHKLLNLHGRICLEYSIYWGLLALLAVYVLNPYLLGLVQILEQHGGPGVLTGALILVLASTLLTLAALRSIGRRVESLRSQPASDGPPRRAGWEALLGRLAPDRVLVNSFPRMSLLTEFTELSGTERARIAVPGYRGWAGRQVGTRAS
jgi:uncharacterized membrane protein